eukprot:TRINITY_DN14733_c0_g1_i2.p1 TRINITY_DN14733_c0_g1~~TRINITY_DN14733_c0_g1_i2.p1  ORF type:complete len:216 (+),score=49.16 TRINITY_DN14733_c0_g1_i2:63-650(+)
MPDHEELPQRERRSRRHAKEPTKSEKPTEEQPQPESSSIECPTNRVERFEYLDHTADIQVHSWGHDLKELFENQCLAMYDYMTTRSKVEPLNRRSFEVEGAHDHSSLLFRFMDEMLFVFSADLFTVHECTITHIDTTNWSLSGYVWGEQWNTDKHPIGTEIKAITFGSLEVLEPGNTLNPDGHKDEWNAYLILDI